MEWMRKHTQTTKALALIIAIVLSVAVMSPIMTNPQIHAGTMETINSNKGQAMSLAATVTIASTALSMLPDDAAAPLADEMSELSTPLMLIVCILYFEQFMLTSMEYLAFSLLIPIALLLRLLCLYVRKKSWVIISTKLLIIAILCACIIPVSAQITNMIEAAYSESISNVWTKLDDISTAFGKIVGGESNGDILAFINNVVAGIGSVFEFAEGALGMLIDGVAILMITCCAIPALTLLLFVWGVKSVIAGRMENLEDTAVDLWKRIPRKKKKEQEDKKNVHPSLPA